jgi:hypothetical protein
MNECGVAATASRAAGYAVRNAMFCVCRRASARSDNDNLNTPHHAFRVELFRETQNFVEPILRRPQHYMFNITRPIPAESKKERGKEELGGGSLFSGVGDVRLDLGHGDVGHHEARNLVPVNDELAFLCYVAEAGTAIAFVIVARRVLGRQVVPAPLPRAEFSSQKAGGTC